MKITLARPLLPTLAGIGAGNSSHFSANYCEAPSLSKSKQASGLEDPRSGADARSVRGRAGILSRGLGVNVCEGCHRTFVRFFRRRDAENNRCLFLSPDSNSEILAWSQ